MDGRVCLFGAAAETSVRPLRPVTGATPGWRLCVASADGAILAGGDDGSVTLWPSRTASAVALVDDATRPGMPPHAGRVYCAAMVSDALAATGGEDGHVCVWDLQARRVTTRFVCPAPVTALAMANSGRVILAGDGIGGTYLLRYVGGG